MSAASLAQIPLAAGGALAGSLMRSAGRAGLAGLRLYMRAPLANTGLLVLVSLTAMATSNALFNQTIPHPAPFFAPPPGVPQPLERPADLASAPPSLAPLPEPAAPASAPAASETTGTVTPVIPDQPVGNAQVFEVQRRLLELGFFQGTVDGYYGPRTAAAIRAFEERHGMTPMGALTPQVVEAITGSGPSAALAPVAEPVAPVQTATAPQPVTPAPAPLQAPVETVAQTATVTIDSIVAAIDGVRATPPQPAEPPVPTAPVPNLAAAVVVPDQPMPPAPVAAAPAVDPPEPPAPVATAALEPAQAGPPPTAANADLVTQVQRGLASLAFLRGPIDGRPSDGLARAIRNFEVYHNYPVTGEIRPELVDMLVAAGATP